MTTNGSTTGILLGNRTYDRAKFMVQIVLPALAVLYASLSELLGLPKTIEVVGTIGAVSLFLGTVLNISSHNFEAPPNEPQELTPVGDIIVTEDINGKKTARLVLDTDPADFIDQDNITFAVKRGALDEETREENSP